VLTHILSSACGTLFYRATDATTQELVKKGDKSESQRLKFKDQEIKGYAMMSGPYAAAFLVTRFGPRPAFLLSSAMAALATANVAMCYSDQPGVLRPFKPSFGRFFAFTRMFESKAMFRLALLSMLVDVPLRTGPIFHLNTRYRFGWTPEVAGRWTLVYAAGVPICSKLLGREIKQLGEERAMRLFTAASVTAIMSLTLSRRGKLFWASLPFFLVGLGKPTLVRDFVHREAREHMPDIGPGELQGVLGSVVGMSNMLWTQMHARAYSYFISDRAPFQFPAVPFALCALSDVGVYTIYSCT